MLLLRGVAEVLTGGSDVGFQGKYPGFRKLGEGIALGLPVPFWFAIGAIAIVAFLMHRTLFGRYCYAIGSNAEAARLSGIPVVWIRLFTYIGAAVLSGVAGMLYVAYLPTATPSLGNAFELHAIAAAVLGGCSLQGGKGTVFGVLIGAGILQITFNAVNLVGQSLWQNVVAGGVILAAVIVDRLFEKNRTFAASKKTTPTSTSTNTSDERAGERGCAGGGTVMSKRILVTGAAGKVGQQFIARLLADPGQRDAVVRALCHNRKLPARDRLEVFSGSIESRDSVAEAMRGVTHVLHLATSKETPESIMDVAVKGLFWLLEAARTSPTFKQFILIGGDAGMGHFFYPHPIPVTETQKHSAYPGCYALSKVLEEVMLEQYYIQYDLNGCCLRAPWIMEKDDFRYQLSFGDDVFGGPRWRDLVGARGGRRLREDRRRARDAGSGRRAREAQLRPRRRSLRGDPGGDRQPARAQADVQRLHGRAGRLRRAGRVPGEDAQAADRGDPHALPLDLAGQQQGEVSPRLASALRSGAHDRRRLRLQARARRSPRRLVSRVNGVDIELVNR